MANIACFDANSIAYSQILKDAGHTVTDITASSNIDSFDLLIVRLTSTDAIKVLKQFLVKGKAILIGTYGDGATKSTFNNLGIFQIGDIGQFNSIDLQKNELLNEPYNNGKTYIVRSNVSYMSAYTASVENSDITYELSKTSSQISTIYVAPGFKYGSNNLISQSKVMGMGWFPYSSNATLTSDGSSLFLEIIRFLLKTKYYQINGTVGNSKQEPIARKLRAYNKASGNLITETTSASDGTYTMNLTVNDPVYVVCLHDSTDNNNSQIQDDIIPILVE